MNKLNPNSSKWEERRSILGMSLALEAPMMCQAGPLGESGATVTRCPAEATDLRLVALARSGQLNAFEELVRRYRNEVFGLAHHFVRNREEAWDISQEVFIKAHRFLGRFRGQSSFKTWLMRITANQCKDFLKRRRIQTVGLSETIQSREVSSSVLTPGQAAEARELGEAIVKVLDTIPFKHRQAFVLREFEGLSYEEMARAMGCTLGTVMSRLHHARRKLREGLRRMGVERSAGRAQEDVGTTH